jgi:hypothetical protein
LDQAQMSASTPMAMANRIMRSCSACNEMIARRICLHRAAMSCDRALYRYNRQTFSNQTGQRGVFTSDQFDIAANHLNVLTSLDLFHQPRDCLKCLCASADNVAGHMRFWPVDREFLPANCLALERYRLHISGC